MLVRRGPSTFPWPTEAPSAADRAAYADAEPRPYWRETMGPVAPEPWLEGGLEADLCIVGGGFTGLWAALEAVRRDPGARVVLLEGDTVGAAASGRNGGFASASLTHGSAHGAARWPDDIAALERLGRANLDGLRADCERLGIDCGFEATGDLLVSLEPHQDAWLEEEAALLRRLGHDAVLLDGGATRREVASPTYRGALWQRTGAALVDPGRLVAGLRRAAPAAGVRVFEHTRATRIARRGPAVEVRTPRGRVSARRVLLATGAHPAPVRGIRRHVLPVYDYVLVSEPLSAAQRAAVGWGNRQGIADLANAFHYYRLTADGRILWGGYDAVYRYGGPVGPAHDEHDATFARLAQHCFTTFPQLRGLRFTHRWGGAIDTCSRFALFTRVSHGGRVAYAGGYTGLGVAASRFGGHAALDLLDGRDTEATRSPLVRTRPLPFPPEPLRWGVVRLTQHRLAAADRDAGRRGAWLRALDALGLGFDS